ncbi:hypothetical protein LEN26_015545 [Aphanomyces euteiches]|nr:hypothetical protein LEN26_015545 [Aphanomyces euteiches]KAH9125157.1 hypothetical protein AeMF1_004186 [Aphanomyces euteiches]KAH9190798.1 hypothetical protein AeNC1_007223 [Aphanomyces euteiches]
MQERVDDSEAVIKELRAKARETRLLAEAAEALSAERSNTFQLLLSEMKRTQDKIRRRDEEERVRYAQLREELKVERAETLRVLHEQIDRSYEQLNRRMKLKTSLMQLQRRSSDETNQLYDQVMALLLNRVSPVDGFNQNGTERLNKDLREEPRSRYPRFEQAAGVPVQDGWTPLHLALTRRETDIALLLLDAGADMMLKTKEGKNARDLSRNYDKMKQLLDARLEEMLYRCFGKNMSRKLNKLFVNVPNPEFLQCSWLFLGIYSMQAAMELIHQTLQDIRESEAEVAHCAFEILSLALKFQINRERVLAIAIVVVRIVRHMIYYGIPNEDYNLRQTLEDIHEYLLLKFHTVQAWKLYTNHCYRQFSVQVITADIVRLQDRLLRAAAYLNEDLHVQVVGNVNDSVVGIGAMLETMRCIDECLESIEKIPEVRQQTDKLQDMAIQMERGMEYYEHQVHLGNFPRDIAFERQVQACQSQIVKSAQVFSQTNQIRIEVSKLEAWMLSSDDILFDPTNTSSVLGRGGFATVFRGLYHGQEVAVRSDLAS